MLFRSTLALYICTRESTLHPVNGVYENLLIVGSDVLTYTDIAGIPEVESSTTPENIITIITNKTGKRQLTFDNANEAREVLNFLKEKV